MTKPCGEKRVKKDTKKGTKTCPFGSLMTYNQMEATLLE